MNRTGKTLTLAERRRYWTFCHTCIVFEQVEMLCDFLLAEKCPEVADDSWERMHPLSYPALVALVVLYARPFKQRKLYRLPEEMIPKQFKGTHKFLLSLRDKMFAHADVDWLAPAGEAALNKIVVEVKGNKYRPRAFYLRLRNRNFLEIKELAKLLAGKVWYHAEKMDKQLHILDKVPDGDYEINVREASDEVLVPFVNTWQPPNSDG
jgi:hypothetical protein